MNGTSQSAPLIHDESDHATGERMRTSIHAQAGFFFRPRSPLLIGAMVLACIAVRVLLGNFSWLDAVLVVAVFGYWPVQEWVLHRYLLHMKPFLVFR